MTLSTACPKPVKKTDREKRVEKIVHAWSKKKVWRQRAIDRDRTRSRTPVKKRNEGRIARKAKAYRRVIASPFNKELRYRRREISGDLCECTECWTIRQDPRPGERSEIWTADRVALAFTPIPCWFVSGGGEPFRRFRSTAGEMHHVSYKFFGDENPAEIDQVRWMWKECHRRIEAEHGTRRRFLSGK